MNAPASRQIATANSISPVLRSMTNSLGNIRRDGYGVFTPATGFSSARVKSRSSFKTTAVRVEKCMI
jgi:hypothetical protein